MYKQDTHVGCAHSNTLPRLPWMLGLSSEESVVAKTIGCRLQLTRLRSSQYKNGKHHQMHDLKWQ